MNDVLIVALGFVGIVLGLTTIVLILTGLKKAKMLEKRGR